MKDQRRRYDQIYLLVVFVLISSVFVGCSPTPKEPAAENTATTEITTASESEGSSEETLTEGPVKTKIIQSVMETGTDEKNRSYLSYYFDVNLENETLDAASFSENLKKIAGEQASETEGELTALSAIKAAVISSDYDELALSYPEDKVEDRLAFYGIDTAVEAEYGAYLAVALDAGLIDDTVGEKAAQGEVLTEQDIINLFMSVATANGDARNFLGYSNDPQVIAGIDQMWNSFLIFDDPQLTELGKTSVQEGITTGYNLKSSAYDARFLPELTLQYGHDTIKHAHQLLTLLNSEDIIAKVQLEPKVSVYQYLLEWGPVPEATPTYEVRQFDDDLYLVFAVEYDLMLEFDTKEDMLAFDGIIEAYAKKYEGNEEAKGLLASSWWQPLYSTTTTDMPKDHYHMIYDCVVTNGDYSIHPFSLPENLDHVIEQFSEIAPDQQIVPVERYCNTAFYNYLKGDDFQ